jgi:hypothetical protein
MLTDEQRLAILNDWFSWSGGCLPDDPQHVIEFMLTSYSLAQEYSDVEAAAYLMTEIPRD